MFRIIPLLILFLIFSGCHDKRAIQSNQLFKKIEKDTSHTNKIDSLEIIDSITQKEWKDSVLKFVYENLDSLYKLKEIDVKVVLLNNYADFIQENNNDKKYRIGSSSIFKDEWFYNLGYLKLFPEIYNLDSLSSKFNGFEFLYKVKDMYYLSIEPSEVLSEYLSRLAYRDPDKFIKFLDSNTSSETRKKIAQTPFWSSDGMDDFLKAISKSKYFGEIINEIKP
jgi:hypothetical protein